MLSPATMKKAKKLVLLGLVKRAFEYPQNWFNVASSSGGYYDVKKVTNKKFDLYCNCEGWKFYQDCSHCQAVREFEKAGN